MEVTLNQVNHFVLRKQHLADETRGDDIVQIVRDIGGLHATGPTVPYLSLFSRTRRFKRSKLDEELYTKRTLGKIRCIRKTVYILPKDLIPSAFAATKRMIIPTSERYSKYLGITEEEYEEASEKIIDILKGKGMATNEIKKALGTKLNVSPIVNLMCDRGLLIRGDPKSGWKSSIHTYYLFDEYFPDIDLDAYNEEEARRSTVERYLACFGPVTENDVAWWTGFPKSQTRQVIEEFKEKVASAKIAELEADYFILSSDKASLLSTKLPEKPLVNLLPSLDPYLMGYKDRERYLEHKYYNFVFDRSGNATSTILIDGQVVGIWDFDEPFAKIFLLYDIKKALLEEIHVIARNLGRFISGKNVQTKECDSMTPLTQRTAGGVMSPLKEC